MKISLNKTHKIHVYFRAVSEDKSRVENMPDWELPEGWLFTYGHDRFLFGVYFSVSYYYNINIYLYSTFTNNENGDPNLITLLGSKNSRD